MDAETAYVRLALNEHTYCEDLNATLDEIAMTDSRSRVVAARRARSAVNGVCEFASGIEFHQLGRLGGTGAWPDIGIVPDIEFRMQLP